MSIAYDSKIVVSRYEHLHGRLVCYSYPTFTGKVILELRGRLPHILWALRCSWGHTHLRGEASCLCNGGPNILLNLGGFS